MKPDRVCLGFDLELKLWDNIHIKNNFLMEKLCKYRNYNI